MMLFPRVLIFLVMVSVVCKCHAGATTTTGSTCSYTFESGACRGHDIWSGKLSYTQCENVCTNRADCKSFQYHGTCWLKNFVCSKSQLANIGQTGSSQYTKHCRDDKDSGCGSPMYQTGNGGSFSSMNFPGKYAQNANCSWIIKVPSRHRIHLYFHGTFDMETRSGLCRWDSVSLYENTSSTTLIGKYCTVKPDQLVSQDDDFRVVFKSDSSVHGKGFRLYWHAVIPTASGCGSRYIQRGKSGSISSMNYPNGYQNNADCAWHIRVQWGMRVRLEFESKFEIEKGNGNCNFDSVAVRGVEASGDLGQSYGVFCGVTAPKTLIISDDEDIAVFFKTDRSTAHAGFRLKWDTIKFVCGIPTSPLNGGVSLSDHDNVNSKATYTCNTGFKLVGANRLCQPSGRWTGNPPICQGV